MAGVSFTIKLEDLVSAPLKALSRSAVEFSGNLGKTQTNIEGLREKLVKLESARDKSFDLKEIRAFNREILQTDKEISKLSGDAEGAFAKIKRSLGQGLGIGVGMFGVQALISQAGAAVDAFDDLAQAQAQIQQSLISTGGIAGRTFDQMKKQAEDLSLKTMFSVPETLNADKLLLGFTAIRGKINERVIPIAQDMASKINMPLEETTKMIGKALQSPGEALGALTRAVGKFSPAVQKSILELAKHGQTAKAQGLILDQLGIKFGGAAEAAGETGKGPLVILGNQWTELLAKIGGVVLRVVNIFKPAIEEAIGAVRSLFHVLAPFQAWLKPIAIGLAVIAGVIGVVSAATKVWGIVQWLLNSALFASPIVWAAAIVIGVGAAVVYAWNKFEGFRKFLYGLWASFKEIFSSIWDIAKNIIGGIGELISDFFHKRWSKLGEDTARITKGVLALNPIGFYYEYGRKIGGAYKKGEQEGAASFAKDKKDKADNKAVVPGGAGAGGTGGTGGGADGTNLSAGIAGVSGGSGAGRNVTINITNLVKELRVSSANLKESAGRIKEEVAKALLSAVNDANAAAG